MSGIIKKIAKKILYGTGIKKTEKVEKVEYDLSGKQLFKNIRIEINADCTRNCKFCPRTYDPRRRNNHDRMPTPTVLSLIDQCVEMGFKGRVGFNVFNEPTLDDRLLYFLDYVRGKGLDTIIYTNGDIIKKDKRFALELFQRITTVVNISLYDYKDKKGRKNLIKQWERYLRSLNIPKEKYNFVGEYFNFGTRGGLVERDRTYRSQKEIKKLDNRLPLKAACRRFLTKIEIHYNGEVSLCPEDALCQYSLGNIYKSSLSEIWFGKKRMEFAQLLAQGKRSEIGPCSKCAISPIYIEE